MTILPADLILAGTLAARAWSTPPPADVPAGVLPAPGEPDSEFDPQAESVRPAATKPVTAMRDMRRIKMVLPGRTRSFRCGRDGAPADWPILPSFGSRAHGCGRTVSGPTGTPRARRPGALPDGIQA